MAKETDDCAALHARQLSEARQGLRNHPNRAAVDRFLGALANGLCCMRRMEEIAQESVTSIGAADRTLEIECLEERAMNAHERMKAAAEELVADLRWSDERLQREDRLH